MEMRNTHELEAPNMNDKRYYQTLIND